MVMAKSGTSFERDTRRRRNITLEDMAISEMDGEVNNNKDCCALRPTGTYPSTLLRIQHNPSVQPTVVSPLMVRQLKIRSNVNTLPATSVVNNMRMVAQR